MGSPTIAIHVLLQDQINSLYCSIAQPVGCNLINPQSRSISNSTPVHKPTTSFGMLANASASNKPTSSPQPSEIASSSSRQNQDGTSHQNDNTNNKSVLRNHNIRKMGWYWGSISPEYAAELLKDEPDGSFLIRDSSNDCYIFSMTLKLENEVHHARIEHSSGYFSFGRSRKFYCTTMVDFIEQAIESSRNGALLFFLHRDPEMMGPVEFRMTPLSRMNGSHSLKHLCRFAILPYVRKSRINELSLPESLKDYLHEPFRSSGHQS